MGIQRTRSFRGSARPDIEILRTGTLLSGHVARHLPAGADPNPVGVPSDIGVANNEGAAELFSRQDHVHDHPDALHKFGGGRDLTDYLLGFEHPKQKFYFRDDFWGQVFDDVYKWNSTGDGGGSAALVDGVDGGVVQLTCAGGGIWDGWTIDWSDIRILRVAKNVVAEFRIKAVEGTYIHVRIELRYDDDNRVFYLLHEAAGGVGTIHALCRNGGAETDEDTGIALDTDFHIYRIECAPGLVNFYVDGVLTNDITTNIPTEYLQPSVRVFTQESEIKHIQVDYIEAEQDR